MNKVYLKAGSKPGKKNPKLCNKDFTDLALITALPLSHSNYALSSNNFYIQSITTF